jgi:hypothetical protein
MAHLRQYRRSLLLALPLTGLLVAFGCYNTPVDLSDASRGPAPLREPGPGRGDSCCYEDSLEGQQIFTMYCGACHNVRNLAERPFSNYQNVAAHMRTRANLTGKEYAKLLAWMRRWADVPNPPQSEVPSPKRFLYSQPISELRQEQPAKGADLPSGPRPGFLNEASPGQPAPGNAPQEAR